MAKSIRYLIPLLLCIGVSRGIIFAQFTDTFSVDRIRNISDEIISSVEENRQNFLKLSQKGIKAIQEKEQRILKQLKPEALKESEALALDIQRRLAELEGFAMNPDSIFRILPVGPYLSRIDSLSSLFGFAKISGYTLPIISEAQQEIANLRKQIGYSVIMQQWLQERQDQWLKIIGSSANIVPEGLKKLMKEWQIESDVYKQQIAFWKEALKDSRRMEREVLNQLNRLPVFQEFMSRNSELARLFGPVGGGANNPAGQPIPGLQSMQGLSEILQSRLGSGMMQGGSLLQQQLQSGMDQLNQTQMASVQGLLQEFEIPSSWGRGAGGEVLSLAQKEKVELNALPFGKRFEFGWNLQSAVRLQNFPAIRDVGLSIGYKLNPRSVMGVGIAYKFGLGSSWKDIEWTHEGIGLRSFIDWRLTDAGGKLFKGFWLTGGFEMNYWDRIANNVQWKELAWRPAGMVGLTKSVSGKKNIGKLQILFNCLDNNLPLEDRISIRWGKTF